MQSVTPHSRFIYFILFTTSAASATRRAGQGGGRAELLRAHPELSWDCQPRSLTGKLAIYVPDYGLYCSRHHTAHLSVFKKALVIAVNPKPSSLSPQGRRRLSAVPPCPPPQALRGARVERGGGTALPRPGRSGGGKRRPQPLATFPQRGRKRFGAAPRAGRPRAENARPARSGAPRAAPGDGQRLRPGAPPPLSHLPSATSIPAMPSHTHPAKRLRSASAQRCELAAAAGVAQESHRPHPPLPRHPGINRLLIWTPECLTSPGLWETSARAPKLGWKGGWCGKGGGAEGEGGSGMLMDAALRHWERRPRLGHWGKRPGAGAAGGAGCGG